MENRNSKNSTENKHPNQYTSQNAKNSNAKNCR